jgi:invasion protein IalB
MSNVLKFLAVAAFVFGIEPAFAQTAAPAEGASKTQNIQTAETGWQVVCRFATPDRAKLSCSMVFETYSANDRVRIASVEIVKAEKNRAMLVSAPIGVSLKEGILVELDAAKFGQLSYSHCQNNGCFATLDLTDAMVANLKKAKILSLTFLDLQGSKIKSDISLAGFSTAFDKSDDK